MDMPETLELSYKAARLHRRAVDGETHWDWRWAAYAVGRTLAAVISASSPRPAQDRRAFACSPRAEPYARLAAGDGRDRELDPRPEVSAPLSGKWPCAR